ncbi:putative reductase protein [Phaeoacremonium minimum UCRPA7]|uniref:Putative reductase protein n=1 Tax=Phaeoacremonium minimum (strain UCR-PA7) TaxID=1286976 RepID=R8BMY6_PHAM7|nr:putative reductase protein [Phaeoacremonium minimum UCRPA7]EOO00697.1 putative reductase protein [Phaeoacremonium minimum UCRPA7]
MKILILGGTSFVGRLAAEAAVAQGHDVTLFNRGNHSAPKGVTSIIGDRLTPGGYAALGKMSFDAVIDTWSSDAVAVKTAVDALRGRIGQYVYVSSVSVYNTEGADLPFSESTPLFDPEKAPIKYIKDKVGGEIHADESGVPTLLARPTVILGPHENVGRLPWWLRRVEKGGKTLAPGPPDLGLQFIDGRDLADFLLLAIEKQLSGAVNLGSKPAHTSFGNVLNTANEVTGGRADLYWLQPEKVLEAGLKPWTELPLWIPSDEMSIYSFDVDKALKLGLRIRSAEQTISDTWDWLMSDDEPPENLGKGIGLDPDKETSILKRYFHA